jgi:hypothetical protein
LTQEEFDSEVKVPEITVAKVRGGWDNHFLIAVRIIVDPTGNGTSLAIFSSSLHREKANLFITSGKTTKSESVQLKREFRYLNMIKRGRVKKKKCDEKVTLKPANSTSFSKSDLE